MSHNAETELIERHSDTDCCDDLLAYKVVYFIC